MLPVRQLENSKQRLKAVLICPLAKIQKEILLRILPGQSFQVKIAQITPERTILTEALFKKRVKLLFHILLARLD